MVREKEEVSFLINIPLLEIATDWKAYNKLEDYDVKIYLRLINMKIVINLEVIKDDKTLKTQIDTDLHKLIEIYKTFVKKLDEAATLLEKRKFKTKMNLINYV